MPRPSIALTACSRLPDYEDALRAAGAEHWSFDVFNTVNGEYPASFERYASVVLTGSRADAFSDEPWVVQLRERVDALLAARKKVLGIPFAGGRDMARWYAKMEAAVEAWAKGFGCTAERLYGRKGWARVTKGQESGVMLWREFAAEPVSAEVH